MAEAPRPDSLLNVIGRTPSPSSGTSFFGDSFPAPSESKSSSTPAAPEGRPDALSNYLLTASNLFRQSSR
jgi:hypothetical protein